MAETIYIRESSNAQIPFQLLADNTQIDLSAAYKVQIVLVPDNGNGSAITYNTTDHSNVLTTSLGASSGKVGYTPQTNDLLYANSPYKVFFWVHTASDAKYAVPDDEELVIVVSNDYV